mgnify:CR=1 FL=1
MKFQALTSAVLCGALAVSLLAGCAAKQPASAAAQSTGQKSHLTIMGTEGWAPCDNWDEIGEYSAFQILNGWLNEADLDITWQVIDTAQYPDALRTLLASGKELPDIIKVHTLDDSLLLSLAEQGLILPLNDIIDEYSAGPARKAFDETYPYLRAAATAEDGNIYWFSNVQNKYYLDDPNVDGFFCVLYRRDWADKLGIAEPTNLEEFTQMLRDFREKDANGNGQQDEIMFIDPSSFRTSIAQWFDLPTDMIALDPVENKMVSPWNSPNVKPYFEYLNSLVQEGILDPSVAGNWELMAQKRAENKLGCLWDYTNAMWNEPTVAEIAPDALYAPLMPLPALDGVEPGSMSEPSSMVWERYVVTKDCEDLEAVARLLDIVYSDEYAVLTAFGQEGVNFTYEDGVMTPIPGLTADMAHEQRISEGAMLWNGVLPRVQEVDMRQQVANCDDYKRQVTLDLIDYDLKYPDQVNNFLALPTKEESDKINALLPNLQTASKELATKLTLGQISVDDLDKEVEKLEELGLSELVDIYQARYERYLANMPS